MIVVHSIIIRNQYWFVALLLLILILILHNETTTTLTDSVTGVVFVTAFSVFTESTTKIVSSSSSSSFLRRRLCRSNHVNIRLIVQQSPRQLPPNYCGDQNNHRAMQKSLLLHMTDDDDDMDHPHNYHHNHHIQRHHAEPMNILESILRNSGNSNNNNNSAQQQASSSSLSQRLIQIQITNPSSITDDTHSVSSLSNNTTIVWWAEIYISKQCELAQIISILIPPPNENQPNQQQQQPKLKIKIISRDNHDDNTMIVDIGQITTIWVENDVNDARSVLLEQTNIDYPPWYDSDRVTEYIQSNTDPIEQLLDRLHQNNCGTTTTSRNNNYSKTFVQQLIQMAMTEQSDTSMSHTTATAQQQQQQQQQEYATMVLQKIIKTGINYQRIIDSYQLVSHLRLFQSRKTATTTSVSTKNIPSWFYHRAIAAQILSNDATQGGRLKRWPCIFVAVSSSTTPNNNNDDKDTTLTSHTLSIINGGWYITDQAVRTRTEARKFVERTVGIVPNDDTIRHTNVQQASSSMTQHTNMKKTPTMADERIFRRLECLAMGELINSVTESNNHRRTQQQEYQKSPELEFDIREVLRTMNLPINPDGAKQALIQTGYWSDDTSKHVTLAKMIQPWSKPILTASKWYTETYMTRNDIMIQPDPSRIDLTQIPCVCVDAMKATFRDDAIGVRLRSSTGRTVVPEASKWEILIHITDVSDLYTVFPPNQHKGKQNINIDDDQSPFLAEERQHFTVLRDAAARRGTSRYDLPFGPLHLLPPIVLQSLSFPATTSTNDRICRCVTIWAYIDERNGQLLDCGIERTTISSPIILTFADATNLLDRQSTTMSNSNDKNRQQSAQAILMIADRNLNLWDNNQRRSNVVAQKREVRLVAREERSLSTAQQRRSQNTRDDGVDGFRRTRGHRLVDAGLNLYTNVAVELMQQHTNTKSQYALPIPRSIGADYKTRGGRVGTAPLRRYIDGQVQRQLLAILCKYGIPMTMQECKDVSNVANQANNSMNNVRAVRATKTKNI